MSFKETTIQKDANKKEGNLLKCWYEITTEQLTCH